jgi:hypothetical protein
MTTTGFPGVQPEMRRAFIQSISNNLLQLENRLAFSAKKRGGHPGFLGFMIRQTLDKAGLRNLV